jgi:hypothetical protein
MASCNFCNLLVERLSTSLQNNATYVNGEYAVTAIDTRTGRGNKGELVGYANVLQKQPKEAILLDPTGKELKRRPVDLDIKSTYDLSYISGRWLIQKQSPGEKP